MGFAGTRNQQAVRAATAVAPRTRRPTGAAAVGRVTARGRRPSQVPAVRPDSEPVPGARAMEGADVAGVLESRGGRLDADTGAAMTAAFGRDVTGVRIHTDARAAASARALQADAYAVGRHIVFGEGRYRPRRASTLRLLAHEIAHTLQAPDGAPTNEPLSISPSGSVAEREARAAGEDALAGTVPRISRAGRAELHRAEVGTYVSTVGERDYLDAGAAFYRSWGYPNVRRVATLSDIVADLDRARGPIDKFRIVSHGVGIALGGTIATALEIGLHPDVRPELVGTPAAGFTSEAPFRTELATGPKIIDNPTYQRFVSILQSDTTTKPLMSTLGAGSAIPGVDSSLGILLRAMFETHYVANVQLPSGGSPRIPNRGVLDAYNQQRIAAYGGAVAVAAPASQRSAITAAIAGLRTELKGALNRAQVTLPLTQEDANTLADPFTDAKHKGRLSPTLSTEIAEGAGRGAFLPQLRRVKARITENTLIEIRGCTIGTDPGFMDALRGFFGPADHLPRLTAPDLFQYYFRLSFETFTGAAADEARLRGEFDDPATGLASSARTEALTHSQQLIIVQNETTLEEVSKRYGKPDAATLRKLNPTVKTPLQPGAQLWLAAPPTWIVPSGPYTTLSDVCAHQLGDENVWPAVWALNPQIKDPNRLAPNSQITIPATIPATEASFAKLRATLRGGSAVAAERQDLNRPVVLLDDARRSTALAAWLAQQRWDPRGRTAAALASTYRANFPRAVAGTYIEFLSRGYPQIVDPIFPDDPEYAPHIISRP
jgi:hypothetical protein